MHTHSKPAPLAAVAAVAAVPTFDPFGLPGVIGAELSHPLALMREVLQDCTRTGAVSWAQLTSLTGALDAAHRISRHSQQISRLAGGRLRQSHERLSLHLLLNEVLDAMLQSSPEAGLEIRRSIKPVEIIVDPGLLWSLLEVAADWAAEQGQRIRASLGIKNWPEHGILILKASPHISVAANPGTPVNQDTLNWHLLQQIAQTMGVAVERGASPGEGWVQLQFPRTVKQLEGLTAVEVDSGDYPSSFMGDSKPMAGHRLLLVTADDSLRLEIRDICNLMGLTLDTTPTSGQAIRFCELDKPHMIVIDEKLRDETFEELRRDLLRMDVNFPCIEITSASNTFEMSNWMGESISRISRDALKVQLPSILVMELAKVF